MLFGCTNCHLTAHSAGSLLALIYCDFVEVRHPQAGPPCFICFHSSPRMMLELLALTAQSRRSPLRNFVTAWRPLIVTVVIFFLLSFSSTVAALSPDGLALLQIKSAIKSDPFKVLHDWNEDALNPCGWTGVVCDPRSLRVVALNITGNGPCGGDLPPACSDGSCSSFQACPSMLSQSPDFQCAFSKGSSQGIGSAPLCLSNGTVLETVRTYNGPGQVACRLTGSLSPAIGNLTHLRVLLLPFNGLSGVLPKEIGKLSFLEVLDVRENDFTGRIPAEFGKLSRLQILNMAHNSFQYEIPQDLANCRSLRVLNFAGNLLSGKIPSFLGGLPKLHTLALSFNQLDGLIPDELAEGCGALEHLHLEGNFLFGTITPAFGNCSNLKSLVLSSNFLSGPIPAELGSLRKLQVLDVSRNSLAGVIPETLGNCSVLSMLVITNWLDFEGCINRSMVDPVDGYTSKDKGEFNYFTGALPTSITSLPRIRLLWAPAAGLLANFPQYWGACSSLEVLNLGGNYFSGVIPRELTRCSKLSYLDLSSNSLEGSIPEQLPIPCMVVFNVSGNFLSGSVSSPSGYSSCSNSVLLQPNFSITDQDVSQGFLERSFYSYFMSLYHGSAVSSLSVGLAPKSLMVIHDLSRNNLTGPIPSLQIDSGLIMTKPTYGLYLSDNQFNGSIPKSIFGICDKLEGFALVLRHNLLGGTLPMESMQFCTPLRHFEAASNFIVGSISPDIHKLELLAYLDLGENNLTGAIPSELGKMPKLEYLILANNLLTGTIPPALGNCSLLVYLDLSHNQLKGEIPRTLADLHNLGHLRLNNNSLSGNIPAGLANLTGLTDVDVAFNNLSGPVPSIGSMDYFCDQTNFAGNPYLQRCVAFAPAPSPEPLYVPRPISIPSQKTTVRRRGMSLGLVVIIVSVAFMAVMALILVLCYISNRHNWCRNPGYGCREKEVVVFANLSVCLTYENVVRATGNFSVDNLIGNGGFGATYKAEIRPGLLVAVKRLYIGRVQGNQQFVAEIQTLGRIRHAHLVTLIGYHASDSEMFLIYNYLPGGNLETLLDNREKGKISWKVLHKIALDVAQALDYLHNGCHPRVLHRDIKPSNILLDKALNAYLSDFGLARFLGASETHATTDVAGTFGYVSPEYAMTGRVSDKADVYSYGVVLLELLSGKKIYDPSFSDHGEEFNITAWASNLHRKGQHELVFAPGLWEQAPHAELVDTLKLAITCTQASQSERPTMKQVVARLKLCHV